MRELVQRLRDLKVLKSEIIQRAFLKADRKCFVPSALSNDAYADTPLPIGSGQTISQPYTVAFMLEQLQPQEGQKILDVGFGSGWTAALLLEIVSTRGEVWAQEVNPAVFAFGKNNLEKAGYMRKNLHLLLGSGRQGVSDVAPFDRILVSAATTTVPQKLMEQLKVGGRMVIPVAGDDGQEIRVIEKKTPRDLVIRSFPGFIFVPLVE